MIKAWFKNPKNEYTVYMEFNSNEKFVKFCKYAAKFGTRCSTWFEV